jgi:hypothetical protein
VEVPAAIFAAMTRAAILPCLGFWAALLAAGCHGGSAEPRSRSLAAHPEQQVNVYTAGDQQWPRTARAANGRTVVLWDSFGEDGSHFGVYGRIYIDGRAAGAPFRANTFTSNRQNFCSVAMDSVGNFVAAWRSSRQQGNGGTIFARRFAADGTPLSEEFQVGPDDSDFDSQSEPSVAMNDRGDFVIAWSSRELSSMVVTAGVTNVETRRVQVRAYHADGTDRSGIIDVVTPMLLAVIRAPAAGIDANGNFAVTWVQDGGTTAGIRVRRYFADGTADGAAVTVNEPRDDADLDRPALAMNRGGDFAVAWEAALRGPGTPDSIYFKRFERATGGFGPQQKAGELPSAPHSVLSQRPALALSDTGELLVAGHSDDVVSVQLFGSGNTASLPQPVSTPGYAAMFPALALSSDQRATIVWQSFQQDGDGRGVYWRELEIR